MGRRKLPREQKLCPSCKTTFELARWVRSVFCSRACANFARRESVLSKRCRICKEELPLTSFYEKSELRKDGTKRHEGICKVCKNEGICLKYATDPAYHTKHDSHTQNWRSQNKNANNDNQRSRSLRIKLETISAYGGKCVCCGEPDYHFLCIDHINNDGNTHRKALGRSGGHVFYEWLKGRGFPKDEFQLLCFNCNNGKEFYGVCPHQEKLRMVS